MVILRSQNKITDFLMILAWACPFKAAENSLLKTTVLFLRGVSVLKGSLYVCQMPSTLFNVYTACLLTSTNQALSATNQSTVNVYTWAK